MDVVVVTRGATALKPYHAAAHAEALRQMRFNEYFAYAAPGALAGEPSQRERRAIFIHG
jgi:hypothetical protein